MVRFRFGYIHSSHLTMQKAIITAMRKNLTKEGYRVFIMKEKRSSNNASIEHECFKREQSLYFPSKPYEYVEIANREVITFIGGSAGDVYVKAMTSPATLDLWSIVFIKDNAIINLTQGVGMNKAHILEVELNSPIDKKLGMQTKVYPKGIKRLKDILC